MILPFYSSIYFIIFFLAILESKKGQNYIQILHFMTTLNLMYHFILLIKTEMYIYLNIFYYKNS
jgi:hypothetical protein